eukprot:12738965-Alexandrium_andersonii.AAC.1
MNSDLRVFYRNGEPVPRVDRINYLGSIITPSTDLTPEISHRIGQAEQTFRKLKIVWADRSLSKSQTIRIYQACILPKLLYGLGTAWPHHSQISRLEAEHVRCVRRILRIPSTYGALQMGVQPINNMEVLKRAKVDPLCVLLRELQCMYFGHVVRRGRADPLWNIAYD